MKKEYRIEQKGSGLSVKDYVRGVLGFSARTLKNAKYNGEIAVNGVSVHTDYTLNAGDLLILEVPDVASETIVPQDIPIEVLCETEDFLVVNKPSGMASHPTLTHKDGTLANAVMHYYRSLPFTFRLLTRLDADTTGACIIAKNAYFAGLFSSLCPVKTYNAICVGTPSPEFGKIDAPIARAADSIIKRKIDTTGKPAQTLYRTIEQKNGLSLVEVTPLTGRTHQIRLHMAHIGCPLYGDFLYGTEIPGERTRLHCRKIAFSLPQSEKRIEIEAPLPPDFFELM